LLRRTLVAENQVRRSLGVVSQLLGYRLYGAVDGVARLGIMYELVKRMKRLQAKMVHGILINFNTLLWFNCCWRLQCGQKNGGEAIMAAKW
jgi:hypothetical protein